MASHLFVLHQELRLSFCLGRGAGQLSTPSAGQAAVRMPLQLNTSPEDCRSNFLSPLCMPSLWAGSRINVGHHALNKIDSSFLK